MSNIGVNLNSDVLVLTRGRDFKWSFENLDEHNLPVDFPPGDLYFELQTRGETNAIQEVKVEAASGGTYAFTFGGVTTVPIDYYDVTSNPHSLAGDITDALEGLSSIGPGNVYVHPAKLIPVWELNINLNGGVNEVQTITIGGSPTGGTFTLSYGGDTTDPIAYNATAADVQAALFTINGIGVGNVSVTGAAGGPYTVTFVSALAAQNVAQITADASGLTSATTATVTANTTTKGVPALTEPIINVINKTVNDFFNGFESLLGVDVDFVVHDNANATLKVTSLKTFEESALITFVVNVTGNAIEQAFNAVPSLVGVLNTINIDFYWNHVYQVEFVGTLGNAPQPALVPDTTLLTGLNGKQTVTVDILEPGKAPLTLWNFVITGSTATIKVESEEVNKILNRCDWQLVFLPQGEVAGGDPVGLGLVSVRKPNSWIGA